MKPRRADATALRILDALCANGPQTGPELAQRLDLSTQSVRGWLNALDDWALIVELHRRPKDGGGGTVAVWDLHERLGRPFYAQPGAVQVRRVGPRP